MKLQSTKANPNVKLKAVKKPKPKATKKNETESSEDQVEFSPASPVVKTNLGAALLFASTTGLLLTAFAGSGSPTALAAFTGLGVGGLALLSNMKTRPAKSATDQRKSAGVKAAMAALAAGFVGADVGKLAGPNGALIGGLVGGVTAALTTWIGETKALTVKQNGGS